MTFYFPYYGSKRLDMKFLDEYIDLADISTIVEPFCGSSAFSYHCFSKLGFKGKFDLRDADKRLIGFLKKVKENKGITSFIEGINKFPKNPTTEQYLNLCKDPTYGYYYSMKVYGIRKGMPPMKKDNRTRIDASKYTKFDDFYLRKKTKVKVSDFKHTLAKYKDDVKALVFLDPPYLDSLMASIQITRT
jgi:site-specific DNA-adenine methylase